MKHIFFVFLFFLHSFISVSQENPLNVESPNLKNQYNPIQSINSDDFSDLVFLDQYVKDKRVVFLGESHHGINDFNVMKFRLIRYLHQNHGFEVVAFESGISTCGLTNLVKDSISGMEILARSLMGIWRVKGNCDLMSYIRDSKMELAGIDPNIGALGLDAKLYNHIFSNIDLSKKNFDVDSLFLHEYSYPKSKWYHNNVPFNETRIDSIANSLINQYQNLLKEVLALKEIDDFKKNVMFKAIESRIQYLSTSNNKKDKNYFISGSTREKLMAENLEYLLDTLYKGKKIIVWAHNGHISKKGVPTGNAGVAIGDYLTKKTKEESFVIGLNAINGSFSRGMMSPESIKLRAESIENVYSDIITKGVFVPMSHLKSKKYYQGIPYPAKGNLTKMYDGIIFLRDVEASSLIKFNKEYICE